MKFLIVDDSPLIRIKIKKVLELFNVECTEASDGEEALKLLLEKGPYDLMTLDFRMPKMAGLDLIKAMKKNDVHLPVLMVTVEGQRNDIVEALKLGTGSLEYLPKPFTDQEMLEKIRGLLARFDKQLATSA